MFLASGGTVTQLLDQLDVDINSIINLPSDSKVNVDLSNSPIELLVEWFDLNSGMPYIMYP